MKQLYLTTEEARAVYKGNCLQVVKGKHPRVKAGDIVFVKETWAPGAWCYPHERYMFASDFMDVELKYDFDRKEHTTWCREGAGRNKFLPAANCPATSASPTR